MTDFEVERPSWHTEAACRRPIEQNVTDLFYEGSRPSYRRRNAVRPRINNWDQAKEFCAVCPVQQECLEFALTNGETDGTWGGLDEKEREKLRRRMKRQKLSLQQAAAQASLIVADRLPSRPGAGHHFDGHRPQEKEYA